MLVVLLDPVIELEVFWCLKLDSARLKRLAGLESVPTVADVLGLYRCERVFDAGPVAQVPSHLGLDHELVARKLETSRWFGHGNRN